MCAEDVIHICLRMILIYSVKFFTVLFLDGNYPLYGKETGKSAILVLLFQNVQLEIQAKHLTGMRGENNLLNAHLKGIVAQQSSHSSHDWG